MPEDYVKTFLKEGDFELIFSNKGGIYKKHPFLRAIRNPENKKDFPCFVCGQPINKRSKFGLCKEHDEEGYKKKRHSVDWIGQVRPAGYEIEDCIDDKPIEHRVIAELLIRWAGDGIGNIRILDNFVRDVIKKLLGRIPGSTSLQEMFEGNFSQQIPEELSGIGGPDDIIALIEKIVDDHFNSDKFGNVLLDSEPINQKPWKDIPLRIVAGLFVLALACEEANQGDAWYAKVFNRNSKRAGCLMSAGWYVYMRHTDATMDQIRMSLRGPG